MQIEGMSESLGWINHRRAPVPSRQLKWRWMTVTQDSVARTVMHRLGGTEKAGI